MPTRSRVRRKRSSAAANERRLSSPVSIASRKAEIGHLLVQQGAKSPPRARDGHGKACDPTKTAIDPRAPAGKQPHDLRRGAPGDPVVHADIGRPGRARHVGHDRDHAHAGLRRAGRWRRGVAGRSVVTTPTPFVAGDTASSPRSSASGPRPFMVTIVARRHQRKPGGEGNDVARKVAH